MKRMLSVAALVTLCVWSGSAAAGELNGRVTFPSGSPCDGCKLEFMLYSGGLLPGGKNYTVRTDSRGSFSLSVPECYWTVKAFLEGSKVHDGYVDTCPRATFNFVRR